MQIRPKVASALVALLAISASGGASGAEPAPASYSERVDDSADGPSRRVWGDNRYGDLVLSRTVRRGDDSTLWEGRLKVMQGKMRAPQKKVTATLHDDRGPQETAQSQWEFGGAWPKRYRAMPLDSADDGGVLTETVTLAFEEMRLAGP